MQHHIINHTFLLGILLILATAYLAAAQSPGNDVQNHEILGDSVKYGFLPALGYSSDVGFAAGGVIGRYHYKDGFAPYFSKIQTSFIVTTRGLFSLSLYTDHMETFGQEFRSLNKFSTGRQLETPWFGLRNNSNFDPDLWDEGYYFYASFFLMHEYRGRKRIWNSDNSGGRYLDAMYINDIRGIWPKLGSGNSLFAEQDVTNSDGSWVWLTGLGLHWESRDNEIAATTGNTVVLDLLVAPGVIANHQMWWTSLVATQYYTRKIIFPITLAMRGAYMQAGGDVPFYAYPELGGEFTMRGYAQGRFRDDAILFYTAELRTWLFQYPDLNFRIGGQLFVDGGRTYQSGDVLPSFFENHKRTFGIGGAMSLFTDEFLIRADLGFSDEISRLYLGIGYTF